MLPGHTVGLGAMVAFWPGFTRAFPEDHHALQKTSCNAQVRLLFICLSLTCECKDLGH